MAEYKGANNESTVGANEKATYAKKIVKAVPGSSDRFKKIRKLFNHTK